LYLLTYKGGIKMTKPNYQRAISLTESENNQTNELQAKGVKVIDIFRMGLALSYSAEFNPQEVPQGLIDKVKKLI